MTTTALLAALLVTFALVMATTARAIRRENRGRHHLLMRTRVRTHLGRKRR